MAKISTKLDSGLATFTFEDLDGEVFSKFRINPADVGLVKRAEETDAFFAEIEKREVKPENLEEMEREVGEKLNYFLGYDSYEDVFGVVGPLTVLPDGRFFVSAVMEKVAEAIEPLIAERHAKMRDAMGKYTDKYETAQAEKKPKARKKNESV